jgi:hypothetical protein
VNRSDADRLALLDRIADRVPELDLDQHEVEWTTLDDGHQALLVNGGGIDGGNGAYFANHGDDVHAVGMLAPLIPGAIGCVVLRPDGSRYLARVMPDPLARSAGAVCAPAPALREYLGATGGSHGDHPALPV